jgi:hypothetical protein
MIKIQKKTLIQKIQDIKQIEIDHIKTMTKIIQMMDRLIQIKDKLQSNPLIINTNGKKMYILHGGEIIKIKIIIIMKHINYLTLLDMTIKYIQIIVNNLIIIICKDKFLIMTKKENYFFRVIIHLTMI